jgi:DNA-directed RNA polymerase I subunit RPA2
MEIACLEQDIRRGETTHIELDPAVMLSQVASMTPFSDYNQSPRNMYQCQMGKQTMGTPAHALRHRTDNKLYRIQNVQAPVVQNQAQRDYSMDDYPQGCNAVVAVISYTGTENALFCSL